MVERPGCERPEGGLAHLLRRLTTATCLAGLAVIAGCSDDFARLGTSEITTASIGISNQDRIIRKVGTGQAARPLVPSSATRQPYPFDKPAARPGSLVASVSPRVVHSRPYVSASALPPAGPTKTNPAKTSLRSARAAISRRDSFGAARTVSRKPHNAQSLRTASVTPARDATITGAAPSIPPARREPTPLRRVGSAPARTVPDAKKRLTATSAKRTGEGYTVRSGDTVYSISQRLGVSASALVQANGIVGNRIRIGQTLVVPGRTTVKAKPVEVARTSPAPRRTERAAPRTAPQVSPTKPRTDARRTTAAPVRKAATGTPNFAWPVRGKVLAKFGERTVAGRNDGIDIAVPTGTSVKAVADGEVLYSGSEIEGFGNLILVRHSNGWVSAYANSKSNLVRRGDRVRRGQTIARSGRTGSAPQPQLHFELRRNSQPVDPSRYLKG